MFWDRRIGDRRGKKSEGERAPERRAANRDLGERRHWTCGVLYRTTLHISEIEGWLERSAKGEWAVGLEGVEENLQVKVLKIMFENQSDKESFMAHFAQR